MMAPWLIRPTLVDVINSSYMLHKLSKKRGIIEANFLAYKFGIHAEKSSLILDYFTRISALFFS
jgi:hypothetical protein